MFVRRHPGHIPGVGKTKVYRTDPISFLLVPYIGDDELPGRPPFF